MPSFHNLYGADIKKSKEYNAAKKKYRTVAQCLVCNQTIKDCSAQAITSHRE